MEATQRKRRKRRDRRPPLDRESRRTFIYRLYDEAGEVLYIGRSVNPLDRLKVHHASNAWWAPRATGLDVWGPYTWDQAVRLEREAITAAQPPGNIEFVTRKNKPAFTISA